MPDPVHPSVARFLARLGQEAAWGQVQVRREGEHFELRHLRDRAAPTESLRLVPVDALRELASRTSDGAFRPLKSAPSLVSGWRCTLNSPALLGAALSHLYPGSLADAWALETGTARPQTWSAFTGLLLGRARSLARLSGPALVRATTAACAPEVCLKHRLWTAPDLPAEGPGNKSDLPCLEPCALFVAFARTCVTTLDAPTIPLHFAPDDLATLAAALRHALGQPPVGTREGEVSDPLNPRRILRVLSAHGDAWRQADTLQSISASDE